MEDPPDTKEQLAEVVKQWMEFYKTKKFSQMGKLYTQDCKYFKHGAAVVTGKKGREKELKADFTGGAVEALIEAEDVLCSGEEMATEYGKYTMYDKEHEEVNIGNYILVWKKEKNKWLIHQEMINSNGLVGEGKSKTAKQIVDFNISQWEKTFKAANFQLLSELYTEDCTVIPPDQNIKSGREELEQLWEKQYEFGTGVVKLDCLTADFMGDEFINEHGNFTYFNKRGDQMDHGNYINTWKKVDDDKWCIHYHIFTSDVVR